MLFRDFLLVNRGKPKRNRKFTLSLSDKRRIFAPELNKNDIKREVMRTIKTFIAAGLLLAVPVIFSSCYNDPWDDGDPWYGTDEPWWYGYDRDNNYNWNDYNYNNGGQSSGQTSLTRLKCWLANGTEQWFTPMVILEIRSVSIPI